MAATAANNAVKKAGVYSSEFTSAVGSALNTAAEKVANTAESVGDAAQRAAEGIISVPTMGLQSGVKLLFFLASLALFLFLFLVGIHYTVTPVFSFFPGDSGIIPIASTGDKQMSFDARVATQNESCNFSNLYGMNTAFAFDLYVTSEFTTTVPRVVWYKSAAPVPLALTDTEASLPAKFPNSNVVLFVDSLKNDLKVMIRMKDSVANTTSQKIETAIENLPLRTPTRIGMVIFKKFVEIYHDGNLVRTIAAENDLLNDETTAVNVFGPPTQVSGSVKVSRITYWPYVISPKMFRVDAADKAKPGWFA